jgi:hypothetical protein
MAHLLPELPCSEGINQSCFGEAENMKRWPNYLSAKSITQIPAIYSLHWQPVPGQVTVSVSRFELILCRERWNRGTHPSQYPIIYYYLQHLPWMFTLYQPSGNRRTWRRARGCCEFVLCITVCVPLFLGKDIVFRFIIECSSLRDFGPQVPNGSLFIWGFFERLYFWLMLKLEISY